VRSPCSHRVRAFGGDSWGRGPHRGANVGLWLTTSDLKVLRSWGADHVRAQMLPKNMPVIRRTANDVTFTEDAWQRLDAFVARPLRGSNCSSDAIAAREWLAQLPQFES